MGLILLIVLILLLVGSFPTWPYSRGWGYHPTGVITFLLILLIVLALLGQIVIFPHPVVAPVAPVPVVP